MFLGCYKCSSLFTLSTCPLLCFLVEGTSDLVFSAGMQLSHISPRSMLLSMPADSYQSAAEMAVLEFVTSLLSKPRQCSTLSVSSIYFHLCQHNSLPIPCNHVSKDNVPRVYSSEAGWPAQQHLKHSCQFPASNASIDEISPFGSAFGVRSCL